GGLTLPIRVELPLGPPGRDVNGVQVSGERINVQRALVEHRRRANRTPQAQLPARARGRLERARALPAGSPVVREQCDPVLLGGCVPRGSVVALYSIRTCR